jgi:hypothetical protein
LEIKTKGIKMFLMIQYPQLVVVLYIYGVGMSCSINTYKKSIKSIFGTAGLGHTSQTGAPNWYSFDGSELCQLDTTGL